MPDSLDYDLDPQPMVWCHDLEAFVTYVAKERGVEVVDVLKLIGLDRGQGHCQLTMQPHKESDLLPPEAKVSKRRRRKDGITCQEKAALGVNNLLILATSPVKSENWVNLEKFLETDWRTNLNVYKAAQ